MPYHLMYKTVQWRHNERHCASNHRVPIVYSTFCSGIDHQSFASLVSVKGIHKWSVHSPHKRSVMRKIDPFYDVIIELFTYLLFAYIRSWGRSSWPHRSIARRSELRIFNRGHQFEAISNMFCLIHPFSRLKYAVLMVRVQDRLI